MPNQFGTIARIIDITPNSSVIILVGPHQHQVTWSGETPSLGDVYQIDAKQQPLRKLATAQNGTVLKDGDALRWRHADKNGRTRMEALYQRHTVRRAVRDYLDGEGFIEIDTPLLVKGTTPDAEIESFSLADRYLIPSAEYQIKRMEIGGFDRTYTLTQNFRQGDRGTYRNPEFTMLEWARVGESLQAIETDVERFTMAAHKALGGTGTLNYQGHAIDLTAPWDRLSVRDAITNIIGVTVNDFTAPSLLTAVKAASIETRSAWHDDAVMLFTLVLDHIQPHLGFKKPVFLTEWPSFLTSSTNENVKTIFIERSELFIAGIELSDGFPSSTDVQCQHDGFNRQLARRAHDGKDAVTLDQRFLKAMEEGFPSGAGMALGFDRLAMILTDQPDIANVLAFGWDEL
jgi:elongation factor P--beta-lysine ligase